MRKLLVALLLLVSACSNLQQAVQPNWSNLPRRTVIPDVPPIRDFSGTLFPYECTDTSMVQSHITLMNTEQMDALLGPVEPGMHRYGEWQYDGSTWGHIFIDMTGLDIDQAEIVLHHEQCHAKLYWLYRDPRFHP